MSACLALPLSNVVCFLFLQSLWEPFSWLECLCQLLICRNASFLLLKQMLCQGWRLVQGWATCPVQSFTCCVDKCCLSMQTNVVREEQRRVYIWFLQDLTSDPTLTPLPNTYTRTRTHSYSVLLLAGRRNVIGYPRGSQPAGQCLCRAPACSGLDNVLQLDWKQPTHSTGNSSQAPLYHFFLHSDLYISPLQ